MNRRGIKQWSFGVLIAVIALSARDTAHAQSRALRVFLNVGGTIWSTDLSSGYFVPRIKSSSVFDVFVGRVAAVSDRPNRIWLAARTTEGYIRYTMADSPDPQADSWRDWSVVPGSNKGGVCTSTCYTWNADSAPAISSWGPGRLELFMNGTSSDGRIIALLHTWGDNGVWSGRWEVIGTGGMTGGPAAVSWGPGRTDVFVRGGGNELAHKWFENGRWSHWEDLGGTVSYTPSVTSMRPGHLDVSVHGPEGLFHNWFLDGYWGYWEYLDSLAGSPSAAAYGSGSMNIFYYPYPEAYPQLFCWVSGPYGWGRTCLEDWGSVVPYDVTAIYWDHY